MEELNRQSNRSDKRKVTLCSDVLLGNENITFNRRTYWYDHTKCLHGEIPPELEEKLKDLEESMIIEMPLEDPAQYLNKYFDFERGLLSDEDMISFIDTLIASIKN